MADIGINSVFPTAKFLSTDSKGDIQEIISTDAVSAFIDIDGLTFTAKTSGVQGNYISI